jgi:multiple sugar transport system permease protein
MIATWQAGMLDIDEVATAASAQQSGQAYQFAGAFFMLVPSMIFIFFIRRYLFNMWGQVTK